jgi:hypothetical protein
MNLKWKKKVIDVRNSRNQFAIVMNKYNWNRSDFQPADRTLLAHITYRLFILNWIDDTVCARFNVNKCTLYCCADLFHISILKIQFCRLNWSQQRQKLQTRLWTHKQRLKYVSILQIYSQSVKPISHRTHGLHGWPPV